MNLLNHLQQSIAKGEAAVKQAVEESSMPVLLSMEQKSHAFEQLERELVARTEIMTLLKTTEQNEIQKKLIIKPRELGTHANGA